MSQSLPESSTTRPNLTPQFCFNQTALQDFLRLSRAAIDDTISQNLNALLTPSSRGFDPASTTRTTPRSFGRKPIPAQSCQTFKSQLLFPSWQSRTDVLTYCASVATSPDPEDPDLIAREVEDARARERVVDERLDPYSARYFPREPRTERLASLIRQERMVEGIVRGRTWEVVGERCENGVEVGDAEVALERWRQSTGQSTGIAP